MVLEFKVVQASRCPKKDVISALDIYCKSVDSNSITDTNQIKDYIWNGKEHSHELRTMFFHVFYAGDNTVEGFSEFAYLPEHQVLVLDYLCTRQRNHVLFYNFYHMVLQEIEEILKKRGQFIRYIITELSLTKVNGKLIDADSNYFRHLLSNENFQLVKYPYYQPPLFQHDQEQEFNLAIKLMSMDNNSLPILSTAQYISIVSELYHAHYLTWYSSSPGYEVTIDRLLSRIKSEMLQNEESEPIALVQCILFEEGQCPKLTVENVTLPRIKKKRLRNRVLISIWILLTGLTFALCVFPIFSTATTTICSFLTIIAGIMSIVSFRKDFFST